MSSSENVDCMSWALSKPEHTASCYATIAVPLGIFDMIHCAWWIGGGNGPVTYTQGGICDHVNQWGELYQGVWGMEVPQWGPGVKPW